MFPPFTTSLIDNLFAGHIKDLAAASHPLKPIGPLFLQPMSRRFTGHATNGRRRTSEPHTKVDPKSSTCSQGSANTGQANTGKISHPTEWLEDNRKNSDGAKLWNKKNDSVFGKSLSHKLFRLGANFTYQKELFVLGKVDLLYEFKARPEYGGHILLLKHLYHISETSLIIWVLLRKNFHA